MRNPVLALLELLSALSMIGTGCYQAFTMLRDRRDAKRDAEEEARYQARKAEQRRQQAQGVRLSKDEGSRPGTGAH